MKSENILDAIGMINEEAVREAKEYYRPKSRSWVKWGAMVACLCLVVSLATIIPSVLQQEAPEQHSTGAHLEFISTELIEWESNGFKAVVVDTGNSSLFPVGAKLTVIFREQNTEIILDNGTSYGYGEIQIDDIGWDVGTVIDVGFGVYEEYAEKKEYGNKVYAYHVELSSRYGSTQSKE